MKYLISFILTLSILNTKAQKKISLDLLFDAGAVFSHSDAIIKNTPGVAVYDPNTGTITVIPGISKTTNEYKSITSSKISLGVRASQLLKQNLKIYAGLSFSFAEAKRNNTMFFQGFSLNGPDLTYITTEIFNFSNLDIALGSSYLYKKWELNFGITPSIILNSKLSEIKKPADAEIQPIFPWTLNPQDPQPATDNETKSFISVSIASLYQLNDKFKLGLEYNHGLTRAYSSNAYSSDVYQSMKLRSLCLKIVYKLK